MSKSPDIEYIRDHANDGFGPATVRDLAEKLLAAQSEISKLRSALSWISIGQGRAGWRGAAAHASEALTSSAPQREVNP
jgi:hypothetical protein